MRKKLIEKIADLELNLNRAKEQIDEAERAIQRHQNSVVVWAVSLAQAKKALRELPEEEPVIEEDGE